MAFIGHEGFDAISSATDAQPFDSGTVNTVSASSPRYSGGQHLSTQTGNLGWNLSNQQTVIQGAAFERDTQSGSIAIFKILDGASVQCSLYADYNNQNIKVYRGDATTLLGTTPGADNAVAGVWYYVEWEVFIHDTTGTIKVWINGATTPILNLSGLDTKNTANAYATLGSFNSPTRMDDIYLLDGSGSAPFNARLGDYRVYTLVPTGDDSVQFTPSAGSNFQNVDDAGTGGIDEDTTYNESNTAGHIDRFTLTDLPTGVTPKAVELRGVVKKTDAGTREWRLKLDSGGTNSNDTTHALSTNYQHYRRVMETDPTDSAPWTKTKIDALKVGYEVVT